MFTAREFWITRRRAGLEWGSGPPFLTAMVMSLPMRANCFAMRFQRANIACFLTSKMRPMNGSPEVGAHFTLKSLVTGDYRLVRTDPARCAGNSLPFPHDLGGRGRGPLQN